MAPTVIPAKAGIQFFHSPAWMPASAGMTNWVALVAAYGAHVHLAHISPNLASPEGEGFQPSPKETFRLFKDYCKRVFTTETWFENRTTLREIEGPSSPRLFSIRSSSRPPWFDRSHHVP